MIQKILVSDDHPIFRIGLINIIKKEFPNVLILEADNGVRALEIYKNEKPDIVILDVNMPGMNGLEVCTKINEEYTNTKVIILTMYKEASLFKKAQYNGAKSYLVKDNSIFEVVDAIKSVEKGEFYLSESIRELQRQVEMENREENKIEELLKELSPTEIKTLKLVSKNYMSKDIADLLFVTTKSVNNYRSRICRKIGLDQSHNSLLIWALNHKEVIDRL